MSADKPFKDGGTGIRIARTPAELSDAERDRNVAAAQRRGKPLRLIRRADWRISVGCCKILVKQHNAGIAEQHEIAAGNLLGQHCVRRQRFVEIAVFFIAVQLAHGERHGQHLRKRARRIRLCKRCGKFRAIYFDYDFFRHVLLPFAALRRFRRGLSAAIPARLRRAGGKQRAKSGKQKRHALRLPLADRWGVLMRRDSPLAEKESISPSDLTGQPVLASRQMLEKKGMINEWMRRIGKMDVRATFNLVYNASIMVQEGVGYAITLEKLINTTGESALCFRPLQPEVRTNLDLVWKKHAVFSKPSLRFLEAFRALAQQD